MTLSEEPTEEVAMAVASHSVVSHDEWVDARRQLLAKEKEFTRQRDEMTREQRALPWELVEADYSFEGPSGQVSLADLFDGRSQLLVYHFMFDPEDDAGCPICSFWADNFDPLNIHLRARDVTMVAVSHAPLAKIEPYKARMGWSFPWYSSSGSTFNFDYRVSFAPEETDEPVYNFGTLTPRNTQREGLSVFYEDGDGRIFHTYSAYARGIDIVQSAYNYLDLVPKGRDEDPPGPRWVRRHDEYDR
jgi:predicted dithiol-disulfide oxidoreductase (DUF899 family)